MSYRSDYDSWPWNGTREEARQDARYSHQNRDLYDRYGSDKQRAYQEEFDREQRRIEDRKREEREQEEQEADLERRRLWERQQEEWAAEEQAQEEPMIEEPEGPIEEARDETEG